jgi:hypothetical protein
VSSKETCRTLLAQWVEILEIMVWNFFKEERVFLTWLFQEIETEKMKGLHSSPVLK